MDNGVVSDLLNTTFQMWLVSEMSELGHELSGGCRESLHGVTFCPPATNTLPWCQQDPTIIGSNAPHLDVRRRQKSQDRTYAPTKEPRDDKPCAKRSHLASSDCAIGAIAFWLRWRWQR